MSTYKIQSWSLYGVRCSHRMHKLSPEIQSTKQPCLIWLCFLNNYSRYSFAFLVLLIITTLSANDQWETKWIKIQLLEQMNMTSWTSWTELYTMTNKMIEGNEKTLLKGAVSDVSWVAHLNLNQTNPSRNSSIRNKPQPLGYNQNMIITIQNEIRWNTSMYDSTSFSIY